MGPSIRYHLARLGQTVERHGPLCLGGTGLVDCLSEMLALWEGFGANAGARLGTDRTFDHWPMLGNLAGYEVRKHETFRVEEVHPDRFTAFLPPSEEAQEWRQVD